MTLTEHIRHVLRGMGSTIDLAPSGRANDLIEFWHSLARDGIGSDWDNVGRDLMIAIERYETEQADGAETQEQIDTQR